MLTTRDKALINTFVGIQKPHRQFNERSIQFTSNQAMFGVFRKSRKVQLQSYEKCLDFSHTFLWTSCSPQPNQHKKKIPQPTTLLDLHESCGFVIPTQDCTITKQGSGLQQQQQQPTNTKQKRVSMLSLHELLN